MQVGSSAYNFLNHANYGTPYPNTNAPFFGVTAFMQTPTDLSLWSFCGSGDGHENGSASGQDNFLTYLGTPGTEIGASATSPIAS